MFKPSAFGCRLLLIVACGCFAVALARLGVRYSGFIYLGLMLFVWQLRTGLGRGFSLFSHGTARFAGWADVLRGGLAGDRGLILGRGSLLDRPSRLAAVRGLLSPRLASELACRSFLAAFIGRRWLGDRLIRVEKPIHTAVFAPTGRGKGVSVLIPNLLSYAGSVVVTDPKGELYSTTAAHRRKRFRHRTVNLDPFGQCRRLTDGMADGLNPLDFIDDREPAFLDRCRDLANQLIVRTGHEHDPYWIDSAEKVLAAFIAYVRACEPEPEARNLLTVRSLLASPDRFAWAVKTMQQVTTHGGVIRRLGELLTWLKDKELGSVISTLHRQTEWMDSPVVADAISRTSFNPGDLRSGRMSIYICLPPDFLEVLAPLMRMWVGSLLRVMTKGEPSEKNPVLFLLDEAGHLGRMKLLESAVTLLRGYGVRLCFFFQSIGQVQTTFGEHATAFLDNIDTQLYFGVNAHESADAISKRIGETTIVVKSENGGGSRTRNTGSLTTDPDSGSVSTSWGVTFSEAGRPLMRPEEVMVLPEDVGLVFHRNLPVVPVELVKYYEAPEFQDGGTAAPRGLSRRAGLVCTALLVIGAALAGSVAGLPSEGMLARRAWIPPFALPPAPAGGIAPPPPAVAVPPAQAEHPRLPYVPRDPAEYAALVRSHATRAGGMAALHRDHDYSPESTALNAMPDRPFLPPSPNAGLQAEIAHANRFIRDCREAEWAAVLAVWGVPNAGGRIKESQAERLLAGLQAEWERRHIAEQQWQQDARRAASERAIRSLTGRR